jgi:D-3-phosphoglycerate dehydrogenase
MKAPTILIVDDIHEIMLEKFDQAGIAFHYQPDISREEAEKIISNYSGMVIRSKFQVDKAFFDLAPNLRFIARAGAGMDNIDDTVAAQRDVLLIPANEGNRDAVGEHMIGMLLSLMNNLNRGDQQIRSGHWLREANRGYELKGRTVGLIGYGHNGMAMAKKLSGFDVQVLAYDKYRIDYADQYASAAINAAHETDAAALLLLCTQNFVTRKKGDPDVELLINGLVKASDMPDKEEYLYVLNIKTFLL